MKNIYSVTYNKPHNPHTSAPRNANRRISIRTVKGFDALQAFICEVAAHGYKVLTVRDGTGKAVAY